MRIYRISFILLLFLTIGLMTGCGNTNTISEERTQEVFELANPIAENLLLALNSGDYAAFSKDFDDAMKNGLNEAAFLQLKQSFGTKLGAYQYYQGDSVKEDDQYISVTYVVQFEKAPVVSMRVVLTHDDPPKVTGLWFDSPELRK